MQWVTFTFTIIKYLNPYEDLLPIIITEQCGVAVSFQRTHSVGNRLGYRLGNQLL